MLKKSQHFSTKIRLDTPFTPPIFYLSTQELFVLLLTPKKLSRRKSAEFFYFRSHPGLKTIKKPAKRIRFADKLTKIIKPFIFWEAGPRQESRDCRQTGQPSASIHLQPARARGHRLHGPA